MKIGIVNISYQCAATVARALNVWDEVRLSGKHNIWISSQHICFPETVILGYPLLSTDKTIEHLNALHNLNVIDNLEIHTTPVFEQVGWSKNIPYLAAKDLDYLMMVGSDEIWTEEEIYRVFEYVAANPADCYRVNFKNYINLGESVHDFIVPRIWSMKRRGGVQRFYKDDLVQFNDGKMDYETEYHNIPQNICFPNHFSWALPRKPEQSLTEWKEVNRSFVKRKLQFSAMRYGMCSYRWDEQKDKLTFNEKYYKKFGIETPKVNYD